MPTADGKLIRRERERSLGSYRLFKVIWESFARLATLGWDLKAQKIPFAFTVALKYQAKPKEQARKWWPQSQKHLLQAGKRNCFTSYSHNMGRLFMSSPVSDMNCKGYAGRTPEHRNHVRQL